MFATSWEVGSRYSATRAKGGMNSFENVDKFLIFSVKSFSERSNTRSLASCSIRFLTTPPAVSTRSTGRRSTSTGRESSRTRAMTRGTSSSTSTTRDRSSSTQTSGPAPPIRALRALYQGYVDTSPWWVIYILWYFMCLEGPEVQQVLSVNFLEFSTSAKFFHS